MWKDRITDLQMIRTRSAMESGADPSGWLKQNKIGNKLDTGSSVWRRVKKWAEQFFPPKKAGAEIQGSPKQKGGQVGKDAGRGACSQGDLKLARYLPVRDG